MEDMKMPELKDIIDNSNEPEVTKAVFDEMKKIGVDSKENYTSLQKSYEDLKKTVDGQDGDFDALAEQKFQKLGEDIITRQEALDESVQKSYADAKKRMDDIEVALQRPGNGASAEDLKKAEKEAGEFKRSIEAANSGGSRFKNTDKIEVEDMVNFNKSFEKYLRLDEKNMLEADRKAMMVGVDPDGGYVVNPQMGNKIITRLYEIDPMRSLASVESISTGAIEWLVDWDETDASWEEETVAVDADTDTAQLKKKRIPVSPLAARPAATQTLLEDAAINIEAWLSRKAADKFGRTEAATFIDGDGVGKPRGILTYDNGTSYGQIEQVNMGNATALTADGFASVKYSMIEQYLNRGTWIMNRSTVLAATLLKDGTGDYIWKPGLASDPTATILGLPVRMSTTMPAVAASALSVALADWKEAYMIVDRIGITVQRDPYTRKPFVEFYFRKRVGGDVVNYQAIKIGKISA